MCCFVGQKGRVTQKLEAATYFYASYFRSGASRSLAKSCYFSDKKIETILNMRFFENTVDSLPKKYL